MKTLLKEILQFCLGKYIIFHGNRKEKRIALTFDDGPNVQYTGKILDILKQFDVKATFFIVGQEAEKFSDIVNRIVDEGHCLANHTYSHRRFRKLKRSDWMNEFQKTDDVISKYNTNSGRIIRTPHGILSVSIIYFAIKYKYKIMLWSIDSCDWMKKSVDQICECVNTKKISGGDILLFHDDNDYTLKALPIIINKLKSLRLSFATADEMMR